MKTQKKASFVCLSSHQSPILLFLQLFTFYAFWHFGHIWLCFVVYILTCTFCYFTNFCHIFSILGHSGVFPSSMTFIFRRLLPQTISVFSLKIPFGFQLIFVWILINYFLRIFTPFYLFYWPWNGFIRQMKREKKAPVVLCLPLLFSPESNTMLFFCAAAAKRGKKRMHRSYS